MELKPGHKQTEVGVIPEGWEVTPVGQAFDICNNLRLPISQAVREKMAGPFPYYGPTGIQGYINEYRVEGEYALIGEDGDHFLKWRDQSMTLLVSGKFNVNNHAHLIRGTKNLAAWFYYYFSHRDLTPYLTRQGAGRYKLTKNALVGIPCVLPTPPEQEAIAEALSDADALIESLEQLIAKKSQIKQDAMQELLTGKKRLPGFATKPGYKQTEVGLIPEDWEVRRLSEGIKLLSGHHVLAQYCNTDGYGVPYITGPADFPKGIIQHTKYTTKPGTICHANDVLVTVKGSGAGTLVVADSKYCISRQLMSIRVTEWNTGYIYFSLLRDASLFGAAATGLIPGLSRGDILNKVVPLPSTTAEQTAIAAILSDMDAEIAALEGKLAKARQFKQGMMQELLTGRIRLV
jgi:type I restriction enzyme S subunit